MVYDERGFFTKRFREDAFKEAGLPTHFAETYIVKSKKDVLRGMHFQTPPHGQGKLVYAAQGKILDVGVDIRKGSPTFGQHFAVELDAEKGNGLYLPIGFAHGYLALTEGAIVNYASTDIFYKEHDGGIRWDSAGVDWPIEHPLLSEKDQAAPALVDFDSPFICEGSK
jgi:dTDP-4-dehydrorhamnose 3,5-epimerase